MYGVCPKYACTGTDGRLALKSKRPAAGRLSTSLLCSLLHFLNLFDMFIIIEVIPLFVLSRLRKREILGIEFIVSISCDPEAGALCLST